MKSKTNSRQIAAKTLWRVEVKDAFADITLDNLFNKYRPRTEDRALATEITYGVLRWRLFLHHYLAQVSERPLSKIDRNARIALEVGAYQLLLLDRVPARAAVNESVEAAPDKGRGFVNAVLRALASKKDELKGPEIIEDEAERISVELSHPRWMVDHWISQIGIDGTRELCRANNKRPPLTLRVNRVRTGRAAFMRILEKEGVECREGAYSPLAVVLSGSADVTSLPGYDDGLFAVQDEASQLVPLVLQPRPNENILDSCAAPGTKSLQIMEMMDGKGRVAAVDIHQGRLSRMAEEALRLGIKNVTRVVGDAAGKIEFPKKLGGAVFDRLLVDAPCTGLGTIRRRPEIKWKRKPEEVEGRSKLQRAILKNVKRYLKPGGTLVYSTCTTTVEENERAVALLLHSDEFTQLDPAEGLSPLSAVTKNRMVRTWPHITGTDGFTIFKLKKKK